MIEITQPLPGTFRACCSCMYWLIPEKLRKQRPRVCRYCGGHIIPATAKDFEMSRIVVTNDPHPDADIVSNGKAKTAAKLPKERPGLFG